MLTVFTGAPTNLGDFGDKHITTAVSHSSNIQGVLGEALAILSSVVRVISSKEVTLYHK